MKKEEEGKEGEREKWSAILTRTGARIRRYLPTPDTHTFRPVKLLPESFHGPFSSVWHTRAINACHDSRPCYNIIRSERDPCAIFVNIQLLKRNRIKLDLYFVSVVINANINLKV